MSITMQQADIGQIYRKLLVAFLFSLAASNTGCNIRPGKDPRVAGGSAASCSGHH
jgi:hypothetical protein